MKKMPLGYRTGNLPQST